MADEWAICVRLLKDSESVSTFCLEGGSFYAAECFRDLPDFDTIHVTFDRPVPRSEDIDEDFLRFTFEKALVPVKDIEFNLINYDTYSTIIDVKDFPDFDSFWTIYYVHCHDTSYCEECHDSDEGEYSDSTGSEEFDNSY